MSLLSFPDVVDERAARTVAAGVVLLGAASALTRSPLLTALLATGFLLRVGFGPRVSPLALLATRVVVPRLPGRPRRVPGEPKRFAQGIGATCSLVALGLLVTGLDAAGAMVLAALVGAASLEAFAGFCIGCAVYRRLFPGRCARCASVGAPGDELSPSSHLAVP